MYLLVTGITPITANREERKNYSRESSFVPTKSQHSWAQNLVTDKGITRSYAPVQRTIRRDDCLSLYTSKLVSSWRASLITMAGMAAARQRARLNRMFCGKAWIINLPSIFA